MPSWLITGGNRGIGFATVENLVNTLVLDCTYERLKPEPSLFLQIENKSNFVIATTRSHSIELNDLAIKNKNLKVVTLDITRDSSVDAAVVAVTPLLPNGLDYLVNNAGKGIQPTTKFEDLLVLISNLKEWKIDISSSSRDLESFSEEMDFNTVAVLRVSRAFLPLVKKSQSKKIIFISSVLASSQVTFMMVNQFNSYSVAKAALNM